MGEVVVAIDVPPFARGLLRGHTSLYDAGRASHRARDAPARRWPRGARRGGRRRRRRDRSRDRAALSSAGAPRPSSAADERPSPPALHTPRKEPRDRSSGTVSGPAVRTPSARSRALIAVVICRPRPAPERRVLAKRRRQIAEHRVGVSRDRHQVGGRGSRRCARQLPKLRPGAMPMWNVAQTSSPMVRPWSLPSPCLRGTRARVARAS